MVSDRRSWSHTTRKTFKLEYTIFYPKDRNGQKGYSHEYIL